MTDKYGRTIDYIRISVTDRCNLRCTYCMPEEGVSQVSHDEILTYDEIARIVSVCAAQGITKVKLTGGEPLVRKGISRLVDMLKHTKGVEQVTLTTNGIMLKAQMAQLAGAGLDAVNISIDTLDADMYKKITRRDELSLAMEGLNEALCYPKVRVKVNCVPLSGVNESQWVPLADLAKERSVDVRFIEMMPIGLGKNYEGKTQEHILKTLREEFGEETWLNGTFGNGPGNYVSFKDFAGRIGFISAITHKFCADCNRIRLTATGYLKPCLQYSGGIDLRTLLRQGITDEDLCGRMRSFVYNKPEGHQFERKEGIELESQEMFRIGG